MEWERWNEREREMDREREGEREGGERERGERERRTSHGQERSHESVGEASHRREKRMELK